MIRLTALLLVSLMPLNVLQETLPLLTEPESYAVYAAILPHEWPAKIAKANRLVIAEETVTFNNCKPKIATLPEEWKAALLDYNRQNETVWRLTSAFPDSMIPYVLVPHNEIRKFFPQPAWDWKPFYTAYPDSGGYHELSAVGFDTAKTRAIVSVSHRCGNLCAEGKYHFVEKGSNGWRPVHLPGVPLCAWMS